jgi:FkbM family methyltransferase
MPGPDIWNSEKKTDSADINMRSTLKRLVPRPLRRGLRRIRNRLFDVHCVRSYSQEGEDLILSKLFAAQLAESGYAGFYVDVGAHHPKRFSNTYYFYKRGWRGINVDAMPGSMKAFDRERPRDVNVEAAVSDRRATHVYCAFRDPAYNGFLSESTRQSIVESGMELLWTRELPTQRLDDLLAERLPQGQRIDFLSVDVEGHDLAVLRSMDWTRHRPRAVVVELGAFSAAEAISHPTHQYLIGLEYRLHSKLCNSCIFISGADADWNRHA